MAEIKANQLLKDFNLNQLKPVVIIYGNEPLLKSLILEKIKSLADVKVLWGDEIDYRSFKNEIFSKTLFSIEEFLVVRNFDSLIQKVKKEEVIKDLESIKLPNRVFLLVNLEKLDTEPFKSLSKSENITFVNAVKLSKDAFLKSLKSKIEKEGKTVSDENLIYLASLLSNNLQIAKNEVEKLLLYTLDKKEITKEDIDNVISPVFEENIFNFLNKFFNKEKEALNIFLNLVENSVHPFEIQSLILSYVEKALNLKVLMEEGNSLEEAFSKVGIYSQIQKITFSKILKMYSKEDLVKLISKLYILEIRQKVFFNDIIQTSTEFILSNILE